MAAMAPDNPAPHSRKICIVLAAITVGESGPSEVALYDMSGKRVWARQGIGPHVYRMADIRAQASLKAGLYMAKVATPAGEVSKSVSVL